MTDQFFFWGLSNLNWCTDTKGQTFQLLVFQLSKPLVKFIFA